MTVTLSQIKQITGVTAFSNFNQSSIGRSVVFNPTLPALVFDYNIAGGNIYVGLVVGSTQQELYGSAPGGANVLAISSTLIFFAGYIVAGGNVCGQGGCLQNGSDACGPWFISYNVKNNTYSQNCTAEPSNSITIGLQDVIVDYVNQYVYFFHNGTPDPSAVIFAIPISVATTFLANLQPPSSYKVAYITPTSPPSGMTIYKGRAVLYNGTFYITAGASGNVYIWVVPYSSITWNTSYPSSPQAIGSLYQIYNGGNSAESVLYLNYYVSSGSIITEILLYIGAGSGANGYVASIYIYSFNLSTNTATQLFTLNNANATWVAINIGGVLAFGQYISSGTYAIGVYDRKTNSYEQSSQISGALAIYVAEPYYAVVLSGSASSMTITVYQILLDTLPAIQNLTYSNGTLSGTVVNLNGNTPLSGVTVYLYTLQTQDDDASGGTQVTTTTTNSSGQFSFSISQAGYYAVKVIQS